MKCLKVPFFFESRMLVSTLGLCLAFLATPEIRAEDAKPLKVFVLSGQSNMVGRAMISQTSEDLKKTQDNVLLFTGSSWEPLSLSGTIPKTYGSGTAAPKSYGPEITFARDMSAAMGEPIGIIKYAENNTGMVKFWNPKTGRLYPRLVKLVKEAQQSRPIEIVGMLWMQGEGDAKLEPDANAYADNLKDLIETARKDFGNEKMYFVAGRINPDMPDKMPLALVDIVRKAQESCSVPNYVCIDLDSATKHPDKVHYDTKGIQRLGELYAEAMQKLMKASPAAVPAK